MRNRRPIAMILLSALVAAPAARADIAGETVVSGTATFEKSPERITIHASDGAIINYSEFGVLASQEMYFVQPSSESRVLNRVFGSASYIDGGLYANGIVYIANEAGIFFGKDAIVDVGGLYAAAGDISNEDFLAGIDRFTVTGIVDNAGQIQSPTVALVGTAVANHGAIRAPDGTIAFVAGEKVLLTQLGGHIAVAVEGAAGGADGPAIAQTGSVDAGAGAVSFTTGDVYSLAINHTGITRGRDIELRAESGTVSVAGTLDASDRSAGATGGAIDVTGERVALVGAQLDASGDAGGGAIRVGGDLRGEGDLATARRTYVDEDSTLRADAGASGDGGRVIVWADEATAFHGAVSARGGAAGGDGGFAEISGAALAADGDVDLSAPSGETGTLLYDPKDIVLHAGTLDGTDAPDASDGTLANAAMGQVLFGTPDELTTPFDVYESELEGTAANIQLQATNSISSPDAFAVRILDNNSLTMQTRNNTGDETGTALAPGIHLANVSFQTGGTGAITIQTGSDGAGGGGTGSAAGIEVGDLTTAGGSVSLSTRDGAIAVGDVTTAGAAGSAQTNAGGVGGQIALTARDANRSGDSHVTTGALDSSGGDAADGTNGAGGRGGLVRVQSIGTSLDIPGADTDPVVGGGDITVASVTTAGGDGKGTGVGGAGGRVVLGGDLDFTGSLSNPTDGAITVTGDIVTSGGSGATGGNAGTITIGARDTDRDGANDVTLHGVTAVGGQGSAGAGGQGGSITVNTRESLAITGADNEADNQEAGGGGDIQLLGILDTQGGTGTGTGGNPAPEPDGGDVRLTAEGNIERGAQAGPQIRTDGILSLIANRSENADGTLRAPGNIGATGQLQVEGSGTDEDQLSVSAGGRANVHVTNAGFLNGMFAAATHVGADIDITQFGNNGGNVIDMAGSGGQMVVNRVDMRDNQVGRGSVALLNPDDESPDGTLVIATGSVDAAAIFQAFSDGNLVVGTTDGVAIRSAMNDPETAPEEAADPGSVFLFADNDDDGTGALLDAPGAATGRIDMVGDAEEPGELDLLADSGIGTASDPITVSGGARVAAQVVPLAPDPDPENEGQFILDPDADAQIHIRNQDSGDLEIVQGSQATGILVVAGTGDVEVTNLAGGITVSSALRSKPLDDADGTSNGTGGDVTLRVAPGSEITLDVSRFPQAPAIGSGGVTTFDGDVVLERAAEIEADGGVAILGALDTSDTATGPATFRANVAGGSTSQVDGSIGANGALRSFTLSSPDAAPSTLALGGALVRTTEAQQYGANLTLAQAIALEAGTQIVFDGPASQSVTGSAGGFTLDAGGSAAAVPPEATIAKPNGNLTLTSPGPVTIGDGDKVSVAGSLAISGSAVRVTDLSALDISVTSPNTQVFARGPGAVATPGGVTIADSGTDLIGNTVAFSSAPTAVGSGPAPRIATASGAAQNAGALAVVQLPRPVSTADIAVGSRVFDLAIPTVDPGHETQEISTAPVFPPLAIQESQDRAAPGAPVSREEVAAFFACAPIADAPELASCASAPPVAQPAYGSALDTERATEVARDYRELLGDAPDAAAGREALARAAADPRAEIGAATSPAGRAYLTEVARVLGQVRLLGLGDRYREVRADVLAGVASAIGSPQLDAARLGAAVDARAMGMAI